MLSPWLVQIHNCFGIKACFERFVFGESLCFYGLAKFWIHVDDPGLVLGVVEDGGNDLL